MFSLCLIVGQTIFSKAAIDSDHFSVSAISMKRQQLYDRFDRFYNMYIYSRTFICNFESLCEIQPQRLCAIGENMEGDLETIPKNEVRDGLMVDDLRTLPLHVGDESLEKCGSFNLVDNVSTWSRIFGSLSRWEAWHDIFMMDSSNPLCTREEERESTDRATSEQCSLISIALRVQPSYQLPRPEFPIITFSPIR